MKFRGIPQEFLCLSCDLYDRLQKLGHNFNAEHKKLMASVAHYSQLDVTAAGITLEIWRQRTPVFYFNYNTYEVLSRL